MSRLGGDRRASKASFPAADPFSVPPPTTLEKSNPFASVRRYFRQAEVKLKEAELQFPSRPSTAFSERRRTPGPIPLSQHHISHNLVDQEFTPKSDQSRRSSLPAASSIPETGFRAKLRRSTLTGNKQPKLSFNSNARVAARPSFETHSRPSLDREDTHGRSKGILAALHQTTSYPVAKPPVGLSDSTAMILGTSFDANRGEHGALTQPSNPHSMATVAGPTTNAGSTNLSGLVCNVHRTTGREPHALVGATTTILGDKLYVFGGRMLSRTRPELTSDLYELDLIRRHWTKLQTSGDIPSPRYFHSVCALGDTKLVCYGGMSPRTTVPGQSAQPSHPPNPETQPEIVVMSDIHILDVPTRTWTRINASNTPQGRYAHCASIVPSSAIFASAQAPLSALQNNPSSSNPHQGSIGVDIDGLGGAEMIVVGGQDSSNHYIEQISVFNLRSLKWTVTTPLDRSCGAYRSVVTPLTNVPVSEIGAESNQASYGNAKSETQGTPLLIYSNYNFLDVKLELQIRLPDGHLIEKAMDTSISPPGLRFPNGGIINGHFVVSGTYLTSSKQEYALWALDLKTLTWGRIDVGGAVFSNGSWNRGILWNRRSRFVILGHRKRNLVEDYNHRRLNFTHVCLVELEAFGLYENPRRTAPTSAYQSVSAPSIPASIQPKFSQQSGGGRPYSSAAQQLGLMAQAFAELSDMELQTIGGERIPVNSHILARRWGPYFVQLLRESTAIASGHGSDSTTMRQPGGYFDSTNNNKRNSSVTITPSISNTSHSSTATTLVNHPGTSSSINTGKKDPAAALPNLEIPSAHSLSPTSRPRVLYLPHTYLTIQLLVHFLYTSSLPPIGSPLCTPQILCSLLQLARPYQVDGLLEATVERLHQVLDGRNAAAVFNAAAMAAGGGRGTGFTSGTGGTLEILNGVSSRSRQTGSSSAPQLSTLHSSSSDTEGSQFDRKFASGRRESNNSASQRPSNLRINTNLNIRNRTESLSSASTVTSASTNTSFSFTDSDLGRQSSSGDASSRNQPGRPEREVWTGGISSVVGLQKRGLRGLMEGRRLRERGVIGGSEDRHTLTAGITSATGAGPGFGTNA